MWGIKVQRGTTYSSALIVSCLSGVKKDHIESWAWKKKNTPILTQQTMQHLCNTKTSFIPPHLRCSPPETPSELELLKV